MKDKLRKALSELCKDFGLSEKAIEELAEISAQGLNDKSTDEDIKKLADSLVPYAKLTQGEITRKMSKKPTPTPAPPAPTPQPTPTPQPSNVQNGDLAKLIADQLAPFKAQLDKLQSENEALKAEKAKQTRAAEISSKAKELGIPDYLVKRFAIADDADIAKELSDFKQDLVNNNLMSKDAASEQTTKDEDMKKMAQQWADTLPGNN